LNGFNQPDFMNDVYLLTGGNLGNRLHYLKKACDEIETKAGTVIRKSSVYETEPWGFTDQDAFLNQVLCIHTELEPEELLHTLLEIEIQLGRKRIEKMGPRVIDIDILFYGSNVISLADLNVPHPHIADRRFVLTPLNEIAADFIHPVHNKTVKELLQECKDQLQVKVHSSTPNG
jgi:2-amino-4-hydroxy-6-hydroxymethyldihydropteridine diphosphokinase